MSAALIIWDASDKTRRVSNADCTPSFSPYSQTNTDLTTSEPIIQQSVWNPKIPSVSVRSPNINFKIELSARFLSASLNRHDFRPSLTHLCQHTHKRPRCPDTVSVRSPPKPPSLHPPLTSRRGLAQQPCRLPRLRLQGHRRKDHKRLSALRHLGQHYGAWRLALEALGLCLRQPTGKRSQ